MQAIKDWCGVYEQGFLIDRMEWGYWRLQLYFMWCLIAAFPAFIRLMMMFSFY